MYTLDLRSVHQIGKDLKCCLVEDYHRRGMNLVTAGCTEHIHKAPFKKGSRTVQLAYLASVNRTFHRRKPSCCQSKDISVPHLLTPTLIPGHPPQLTCHQLRLPSPNTTVLPCTQTLTISPTSITRKYWQLPFIIKHLLLHASPFARTSYNMLFNGPMKQLLLSHFGIYRN